MSTIKRDTHPHLYTIKRALTRLPCSDKTLRRMIAEGKINARRVGSGRGMLYIPASEIERLSNSGEN
jgi:excisionase family DNA binding protein